MNRSLVRIRSAAAAGLCLLLSGCLPFIVDRPAVALQSVEVTGIRLAEADLSFRVEVTNPNRWGVTITVLDYSLYLNERPVAHGRLADPVAVPGRGSVSMDLPVTASFKDLEIGLRSLFRAEPVDYRLEGTLTVAAWGGRYEFPFNRKGSIPLGPPRS